MEEASEVQKLASKAYRFGMEDYHPKEGESTRLELIQEIHDFLAVCCLINYEIGNFLDNVSEEMMFKKLEKTFKYFRLYMDEIKPLQ